MASEAAEPNGGLRTRIGVAIARLPEWARPYPFEVVTWIGCLAAVLFLRGHRLNLNWQTVEFTVPPLIPVVARSLAIGIGIQALYRLVVTRDLRAYLGALRKPSWWVLTLRIGVAFIVVTYAYLWLKISIPLVNERIWDGFFWRLDQILHLGISPSIFTSQLVSGTPVARLLDVWYGWWFPSMLYATMFFATLPEARTRARFVLSFVLVWYAGAWLYLLLPALGPCYAFADLWTHLKDQFPVAAQTQRMLWQNYQRMIAGREAGVLNSFSVGLGVAAMPSLHVGLHALLTLWIWRYARPLLIVGILGTLLTMFGSLATGWHYAVDGYAGVGLAALCYWAAQRSSGAAGSVSRQPAGRAPSS